MRLALGAVNPPEAGFGLCFGIDTDTPGTFAGLIVAYCRRVEIRIEWLGRWKMLR